MTSKKTATVETRRGYDRGRGSNVGLVFFFVAQNLILIVLLRFRCNEAFRLITNLSE